MCGSGYRENNHWETSQEKTHALRNEPEKLVFNKQRRENHHSVLVKVLVTRTNSGRREQTLESTSLIYMGRKEVNTYTILKKTAKANHMEQYSRSTPAPPESQLSSLVVL